jgi:hypothetical protein
MCCQLVGTSDSQPNARDTRITAIPGSNARANGRTVAGTNARANTRTDPGTNARANGRTVAGTDA